MNDNLNSPFATEQHQMSAQIYSNDTENKVTGWQCSSRIPSDVALSIYQNNLCGGVAQHLQSHFPTAYYYIGDQAYQAVCSKYLHTSSPEQPIFTIYAAHFPGFLAEYGEHQQQFIWVVTAHLAQIDFFHNNTFCEGQRIEVEESYYQLWTALKSIIDTNQVVGSEGLYQKLELHPENYQHQTSTLITLVTFWHNEELFFRVE